MKLSITVTEVIEYRTVAGDLWAKVRTAHQPSPDWYNLRDLVVTR